MAEGEHDTCCRESVSTVIITDHCRCRCGPCDRWRSVAQCTVLAASSWRRSENKPRHAPRCPLLKITMHGWIAFRTPHLTIITHCQSYFEHHNWRSSLTVNRNSNITTSSHYSLTVTFRIWQLTATIYFDHHKWLASLDRCQSHFDHNNWQATTERRMNKMTYEIT